MQSSVLVLLACMVAMTLAMPSPAVDYLDEAENLETIHETAHNAPELEQGLRSKRGLLLLKKKLLLGALGLKAAKVGVVGGAVAGAALAHKKPKTKYVSLPYNSYGHSSHGPSWNVEVHSWH